MSRFSRGCEALPPQTVSQHRQIDTKVYVDVGTLPSWLRAEGGRSKRGALPVDPFNASDQEKQD